MAKSASSTDLANLLESITNGSATASSVAVATVMQEALKNILGAEDPLEAGVEGAADFFAEKLGLQSKNSLVQTSVFVLTKAAILETAQLVGIGGGLVKLDLATFRFFLGQLCLEKVVRILCQPTPTERYMYTSEMIVAAV